MLELDRACRTALNAQITTRMNGDIESITVRVKQ